MVARASRLCGMSFKLFHSRLQAFWVQLFTTYIRPKLDYCSVIWNPTSKGLSDLVEKVQRRYTKRIPRMSGYSYEERLRILGLPTLANRRAYFDAALVCKLLQSRLPVDSSKLGINIISRGDRSRCCTLRVTRLSATRHASIFPFRVIKTFNALPSHLRMRLDQTFLSKLKFHYKLWYS